MSQPTKTEAATHQLEAITVHGRFQPPLHVNHWAYISRGFDLANHVDLLITNPFQNEAFEATASWRNDPENNPFSYDERVKMFEQFFAAMGIDSGRFTIKAFNIKDDKAFAELDPAVPNLVNVYSEWSAKKVQLFEEHGLKVIKLEQAKSIPISGTLIRQLIRSTDDITKLPKLLVDSGFMPHAIPGLMAILAERRN